VTAFQLWTYWLAVAMVAAEVTVDVILIVQALALALHVRWWSR
jgi:hypothetical protein